MSRPNIADSMHFGERLVARLKAEMDVLDGQRCRICYTPLAGEASTLCTASTCKEQADFDRELLR